MPFFRPGLATRSLSENSGQALNLARGFRAPLANNAKDQMNRGTWAAGLALAAFTTLGGFPEARAAGLDDIRFWTGDGTNRAALVIHWSAPEVRNATEVPNPIVDRALMWGYRWNGTASGEQMFNAVVAADPRLHTAINISAFGMSVIGLGYDWNNNRVFGVQSGSNIIAPAGFTNGVAQVSLADGDKLRALDPVDLFWSGWFGAGWETWHEQGLTGGFLNAPQRGVEPFWTPNDPAAPYSGRHGEWQLADLGLSGSMLKDGSWIGLTVAGGGFDFMNPDSPGTIAYGLHKQAPIAPIPTESGLNPFAAEVAAASGPFGPAPYDDPASVLGEPTRDFYDPFADGTKERRVKLVEAVVNLDATQRRKLITTLNDGSTIIARFDHPVAENPANPYGFEFMVFGNAFFLSDQAVNDSTDMSAVRLSAPFFGESLKVSVSPGFTGKPGEEQNNPATWPWYRYEDGPFADTAYPTQGYLWNRTATAWSAQPTDFTKPVNPALFGLIESETITAADAMDLYYGSGGGTGFDLARSGFSTIQYVKVEGIPPSWSGGEIDAFSAVRPVLLGETISIAPGNLASGFRSVLFQEPGDRGVTAVRVDVRTVNEMAAVRAQRIDWARLTGVGAAVEAIDLQFESSRAGRSLALEADVRIDLRGKYDGTGGDLMALTWDGTHWKPLTSLAFDRSAHVATIAGLTNSTRVVIQRMATPTLAFERKTEGVEIRFAWTEGWTHVLERTTDFAQWVEVGRAASGSGPVTALSDPNPPAAQAFYRLVLTRP